MAAVAARLAGVGLCQLDDELRVLGRSMRSSPWLLLRHEMKLVHLPAVSSIQRDMTAYRVQRSSSMRHMYIMWTNLVEVLAKVGVLHPKGAVVLVARVMKASPMSHARQVQGRRHASIFLPAAAAPEGVCIHA